MLQIGTSEICNICLMRYTFPEPPNKYALTSRGREIFQGRAYACLIKLGCVVVEGRDMSKSLIKALVVLTLMLMAASAMDQDRFGGVTYRLDLSQIEITQPIGSSSTNLTLNEKIDHLEFQDARGNISRINVTPDFWRGDYIYRIAMPGEVPGYLIYVTKSTGQQFVTITSGDGPVKVVLPEGYTTGNRLLGIARPGPDEVLESPEGTELIWKNASQNQIIEVSYYRDMAPLALMRIYAIIALAAGILLVEYYLSMRRLRSIKDEDQVALR